MNVPFLPLLWRHLFVQYGKTLALSLFGFLLILLSTRLEEAARLVSTGASLRSIILFIIYQIPYLLQIALPIATLIASLYLFQRLSTNNELTAVRASGIGLFELILPLTIFSILIALFSFQVVFDVSVRAHLAAKRLEFDLREMHPLAVMHNTRLLEQRGISLDMKGSLISDKIASDMIMAIKSNEKGTCSLVIAKKIAATDDNLSGQNLSLISTKPAAESEQFDDLLIENAKENVTPLKGLAFFTNKKRMWKASNELLRLPLLLAKKQELEKKLETYHYSNHSTGHVKRLINRIHTELARRLSLSLAIITFTLLGASFGCSIGRYHSRKRLLTAVLLAAFFLVSFLAARSIEDKAYIAGALYLVPHMVICIVCIDRLRRIQRGVE